MGCGFVVMPPTMRRLRESTSSQESFKMKETSTTSLLHVSQIQFQGLFPQMSFRGLKGRLSLTLILRPMMTT